MPILIVFSLLLLSYMLTWKQCKLFLGWWVKTKNNFHYLAEFYKAINSNLRHLNISCKKTTIPNSQFSSHHNLCRTMTSPKANSKLLHYKKFTLNNNTEIPVLPHVDPALLGCVLVLLLFPFFMLFVFISWNSDSFSTSQEVFALLGTQ